MNKLKDILAEIQPNEVTKENATEIFGKVAKNLMSEFKIIKDEDEYQIIELEFYWCSSNHPDTSVYPRSLGAGNWFFHPSGVDISLNSCCKEDLKQYKEKWYNLIYSKDEKQEDKLKELIGESYYGGILIRTLRNLKDETITSGPLNCLDLLFDSLPADGSGHHKLPKIEKVEENLLKINPDDCGEIIQYGNNYPESKVSDEYFCKNLRHGIKNNRTADFANSDYCFYVNPKKVNGWMQVKGNKPWNKRP